MNQDLRQYEPCPGTYDKRHDFKEYKNQSFVCLYCGQVRIVDGYGISVFMEIIKANQKP
mgnify:CR=1 FL=1